MWMQGELLLACLRACAGLLVTRLPGACCSTPPRRCPRLRPPGVLPITCPIPCPLHAGAPAVLGRAPGRQGRLVRTPLAGCMTQDLSRAPGSLSCRRAPLRAAGACRPAAADRHRYIGCIHDVHRTHDSFSWTGFLSGGSAAARFLRVCKHTARGGAGACGTRSRASPLTPRPRCERPPGQSAWQGLVMTGCCASPPSLSWRPSSCLGVQ